MSAEGLRVVGAGLGRTGTHSLMLALEQLLGGRCYHMAEVIERPDDVPVWHAAIGGEQPDWRTFLAAYEATVDWPACAFWRELAAANPGAIVLLSVRESAEAWWKSFEATIAAGLAKPVPADRPDWAVRRKMVVDMLGRDVHAGLARAGRGDRRVRGPQRRRPGGRAARAPGRVAARRRLGAAVCRRASRGRTRRGSPAEPFPRSRTNSTEEFQADRPAAPATAGDGRGSPPFSTAGRGSARPSRPASRPARADLVAQHLAHRRQLGALDPRVGIPQPRPHERLRAVEVGLPHRDPDDDPGRAPRGLEAPGQIGVVTQLGRAVHPQGLVDARHHEQQPDLGPLGQVRQRVEPVVARPVRQEQRVVVRHVHEPGIAPARSGVLAAVRVGRRQHDERRVLDEPAAVAVEVVELLAQGALGRRRVERPQLRLGRDCRHAAMVSPGLSPPGRSRSRPARCTVRFPGVPPRMTLRRLVSLFVRTSWIAPSGLASMLM